MFNLIQLCLPCGGVVNDPVFRHFSAYNQYSLTRKWQHGCLRCVLSTVILGSSILTPVYADKIYKWHDAKGRVVFSDRPQTEASVAKGAEDRSNTQVEIIEPQGPQPLVPGQRVQQRARQQAIKAVIAKQAQARRKADQALSQKKSRLEKSRANQKKHCDKLVNQYQGLLNSWKVKRRQGYKTHEKKQYQHNKQHLQQKLKQQCAV